MLHVYGHVGVVADGLAVSELDEKNTGVRR